MKLQPADWQEFERIAREEFGEDIWDDTDSPTEALRRALADIADDPTRLPEWWSLFNSAFDRLEPLFQQGSWLYWPWLRAVVASTAYATDARTEQELELLIMSPESARYDNAELTGVALAYWGSKLPWDGPYSWDLVRQSILTMLDRIDNHKEQ